MCFIYACVEVPDRDAIEPIRCGMSNMYMGRGGSFVYVGPLVCEPLCYFVSCYASMSSHILNCYFVHGPFNMAKLSRLS